MMFVCVDMLANGFCQTWQEFDAAAGLLVGDPISASSTSWTPEDLALTQLVSAGIVIFVGCFAWAVRVATQAVREAGEI